MKIQRVFVNNRKAQIELVARSGVVYPVPFVKLEPHPTSEDRICHAYVDSELGREGVSYVLASGAEGVVLMDQALEYNKDPKHLSEILLHQLTAQALRRVNSSGLSRRELARRLKTSLPQLYRLLDPTNTRKSLSQVVSLLHVLDCDVALIVKEKSAA